VAYSLLLAGLGSGLGGGSGDFLLLDGLDDTDGDGLSHVTNGETAERGEVGESLNAHGLGWVQLNDASVTRLDELGVGFHGLTGTTIDLFLDLVELAGNVSGVAIQDWRVTVANLSRVVEHDDLGGEVGAAGGWVVLGVGGDVSTLDVLDRDVLDVEANVVSGGGLREGLVVHLHRLDLSGQLDWSEGDDHTGLDDASLNTTDGHCSNTADLVDILERETEGLVSGPLWGNDGVESVQEGLAASLALLPLNVPSLVPSHVGRWLQHVVSMPSGNGDEWNGGGIVSDLLDESSDFLLDFLETGLGVWWLGGVHLVDTDDELLDAQGVSEEGVLTGLTILGDTGLEFTGSGGDDQHTAIGLRSTSDHVLDEIPVSGSVDDGDVELLGLELPQGDIDGDTTLTLGLQLVQHPGVLEGTLAHLLGFLLELLDGTLVDATALVDQVTGGGGLAGVDVSNDDNVDVSLLGSSHLVGFLKDLRRVKSGSETKWISPGATNERG